MQELILLGTKEDFHGRVRALEEFRDRLQADPLIRSMLVSKSFIYYDAQTKSIKSLKGSQVLTVPDHYVIRKAADETTSSDTTLSSDSTLKFWMEVNEVWQFLFMVMADAAAGDIKFGVDVPTGATGRWGVGYQSTADAVQSLTNNSFPGAISMGTGITTRLIPVTGCIVNAAVAGYATLQWAQDASDAAVLTVRSDSYLLAHRV